MCRHAGYIGPSSPLAPVMTDLDHSLLKQSYLARELMDGQTVNADGFGVAWYDPDVRPEPARYVNPFPIWSDPDLPGFGALTQSPCFIGNVRNATVAGTTAAANCAPYVDGRWSFSLNGYLTEFQEQWRTPMMREWISDDRLRYIHGVTDTEFLFQALLTRMDDGAEPAHAIKSLSQDVAAFGRDHDLPVQLNLLLSDGDHLYATRDGTKDACNSLYHLHDGEEFPDAHVIASEPLMDDPEWAPVEPGTLLVLSGGAPTVRLTLHA